METMALERIDLERDLFTCSYPLVHEPLLESMKRVGVLRPVTLVSGPGRFVVASGVRRAVAAHHLGLTSIGCHVLEEPHPGEQALFLMNLEDNLSSRPLNLFEKARAVKRLAGDPETCRELLGVSDTGPYLALDGLDDSVKSFVLDKGLGEAGARIFTDLESCDAVHAAACARRLNLTVSQTRELVDYGREIAERDSSSFMKAVRCIETAADEENSAQRRQAFIELLRAVRLPAYTASKKEIDGFLAPVNGIQGLHMTPPPYLEGDVFTATIRFRTTRELAKGASALLDYSGSEALASALRLLEG